MSILPDLRGVVTELDDAGFQDLFIEMGIGRGLKEYERGKKMLSKWEYNWLDYGQAVIELAKWGEV